MSRIKVKIKEIADVKNGSTPSTSNPNFFDGEIIWITPKDLSEQNKKYIIRWERTITEQGLKSCSTVLIPKWTILLSSRAPIGLLAIAWNELCTNQGFKNLVPNIEKIDSEFLYYYIKIRIKEVEALWSGTTFKEVSKNSIENYEIEIPEEINEQKKISSILSNLDSKIELNNKINSELEKMVKTLYDYWFVQFDFPDENWKHYKSSGWKMVFSDELKREIPEVWEVENLKENSLTKLIKPWIDIFDNEKIYLATADVQNNDINFQANKITFEKRETRANMQPIKNSIWFAKMKNSKKVLYFWEYSNYFLENIILSTWFAWLKCENYTLEYIWGFINNDNFEFIKDRLSNWATQEAINNDWLEQIKLIIPNDDILKNYHKKTYWIYKKIYLNQTENQKLAELRDFLLPMLMNWQVSVK